MTKAIKIFEHGGPEVLSVENIKVENPGPTEILLKQTAVGLNFIDCYQRSGLYPMDLPIILGSEAVGVVAAVGTEVANLSVGQRVAYGGGQAGAYSEERLIEASAVVPLPDYIDDKTGAAMMLKGMTVHMLLFKCYAVKAGDTILVHAAAGGVGSILCQWANSLGATVIGTVGSELKAEKAKSSGCSHVINYQNENFVEKVKDITDGKGVPVVYDSTGKDTVFQSLDCLERFGYLITYGNSSGPVPALEPLTLMQKGSINLCRPTLIHYVENDSRKSLAADELFKAVKDGKIKIEIGQTFPLENTKEAHEALEKRLTSGSTVLLID